MKSTSAFMRSRQIARFAAWLLLPLLALALLPVAIGQQLQDPPGRVARLSYHEGTVSFSPAGDDSWYDVAPNRPLTSGDRLWTDRQARAELHIGSAAVRLDDQTSLTLADVDDDGTRLVLPQGSMQLRVRDTSTAERFEIDTDNLALWVDRPGEYRVDVDPSAGTTRVAVASGQVTLQGEGGESLTLGPRQQLTLAGRNLATVSGPVRAGGGSFERWVAERDRLEDQSISARYVSRDVLGYQQLDRYGDWQTEPGYGAVWYPRVDADWAPYREGQWVEVEPWGWTWIDAAPWGFAPSHYGRWARFGPRWGWVPGRRDAPQVYAPALVGFVGGAGAGATLSIGNGRDGVGWFPLAPGEPWQPGYRASRRYVEQANRAAAYERRRAAERDEYLHRNTPSAVTVVPIDLFGRGPIHSRDRVRLPDGRFDRGAVAAAPPVPMRGDRGNFGHFGRPAAALPPAALQARQAEAMQAQRELLRQQQQPLAGSLGFGRERDARTWQTMPDERQQQLMQRQQRAAAQAQAAQQQQQMQQQMQMQQQQQQQLARQQQEMQQRALQAQQQQQQLLQQQRMQQLQAQQQQQAQQQFQAQQQQQARQQAQAAQAALAAQQQQGAARQALELQQRAIAQQQRLREQQLRGGAPAPAGPAAGQWRDAPALADRP